MNELEQLRTAMDGRQWPILAALLIGALVRLSKTPAAGEVWQKVPKRYRPIIPAAMGLLSGISEAIIMGTPYGTALAYGILSGLLAIGGDQLITTPIKEEKPSNTPAAAPEPEVYVVDEKGGPNEQ